MPDKLQQHHIRIIFMPFLLSQIFQHFFFSLLLFGSSQGAISQYNYVINPQTFFKSVVFSSFSVLSVFLVHKFTHSIYLLDVFSYFWSTEELHNWIVWGFGVIKALFSRQNFLWWNYHIFEQADVSIALRAAVKACEGNFRDSRDPVKYLIEDLL